MCVPAHREHSGQWRSPIPQVMALKRQIHVSCLIVALMLLNSDTDLCGGVSRWWVYQRGLWPAVRRMQHRRPVPPTSSRLLPRNSYEVWVPPPSTAQAGSDTGNFPDVPQQSERVPDDQGQLLDRGPSSEQTNHTRVLRVPLSPVSSCAQAVRGNKASSRTVPRPSWGCFDLKDVQATSSRVRMLDCRYYLSLQRELIAEIPIREVNMEGLPTQVAEESRDSKEVGYGKAVSDCLEGETWATVSHSSIVAAEGDSFYVLDSNHHGTQASHAVLQYACFAALHAGCPFLWIDKLCIIQDGHGLEYDDWRWHIQHDVALELYRHAALCIVLPAGLLRCASRDEETLYLHRTWTFMGTVVSRPYRVLGLHRLESGCAGGLWRLPGEFWAVQTCRPVWRGAAEVPGCRPHRHSRGALGDAARQRL
ncbi:hypothetical protein BD413DRAFT_280504 [Trametes elegans]|nr:hypothetical protein BD413DRAFT_280504 [Trametes elegans]